jgi:hypothetical protein
MTPDDALADELRRHLAALDVEILRLKRQIGELRSAIAALLAPDDDCKEYRHSQRFVADYPGRNAT